MSFDFIYRNIFAALKLTQPSVLAALQPGTSTGTGPNSLFLVKGRARPQVRPQQPAANLPVSTGGLRPQLVPAQARPPVPAAPVPVSTSTGGLRPQLMPAQVRPPVPAAPVVTPSKPVHFTEYYYLISLLLFFTLCPFSKLSFTDDSDDFNPDDLLLGNKTMEHVVKSGT